MASDDEERTIDWDNLETIKTFDGKYVGTSRLF